LELNEVNNQAGQQEVIVQSCSIPMEGKNTLYQHCAIPTFRDYLEFKMLAICAQIGSKLNQSTYHGTKSEWIPIGIIQLFPRFLLGASRSTECSVSGRASG
ncbi:hypothetical protein ALC57_02635, partial [Trachymyrmex cornetzi]